MPTHAAWPGQPLLSSQLDVQNPSGYSGGVRQTSSQSALRWHCAPRLRDTGEPVLQP